MDRTDSQSIATSSKHFPFHVPTGWHSAGDDPAMTAPAQCRRRVRGGIEPIIELIVKTSFLDSETNHLLLSKIATSSRHGENSHYFDGWKAYDSDPYHPTENSNGVVQMGLAENQLCFELIKEWIVENPEASICTSEGVNDFRDVAIFEDYHGFSRFVHRFLVEVPKILANRHQLFTEGIAKLGISYLKSNGGLFVWMDLKHLLEEPTPPSKGSFHCGG
ncbi:1-aminocyclopropane-1-carboxylate synthase-like protein [Drosera capensis]